MMLLAKTTIKAKLNAVEIAHKIADQSVSPKLKESSFITIIPASINITAIQTLTEIISFKNNQLRSIAIMTSLRVSKISKVGEAKFNAWQME